MMYAYRIHMYANGNANVCIQDYAREQMEENISRQLLPYLPCFVLIARFPDLYPQYSKWIISRLLARFTEFQKSLFLDFIPLEMKAGIFVFLRVTFYLSINILIFIFKV